MQQSACQARKRATRSHAAICGSRAGSAPKELRPRALVARVFPRLASATHAAICAKRLNRRTCGRRSPRRSAVRGLLDLRAVRMNWGDHMKVLDSHNHWSTDAGAEVLEQLARADTPAIATDPTGHVTYWNPAAERLFGRAAHQALGRRC